MRPLAVLPILLFAAGCFEGRRTITVRPDGGGTLVDTIEWVGEMRETPAGQKDPQKVQANLKRAAEGLGPGVSGVSHDSTDSEEKVVFAFKDVRTLRAAPVASVLKTGVPSLTFRLADKGSHSVLTVVLPPPTPSKPGVVQPSEGWPDWEKAKEMMKGLKFKTVVALDGKLLKANTPDVEGSTVTVLELDFDKISADAANYKKFTQAGPDPDSLDPKKLRGIRGVKVPPTDELVIEFARR